MTVGRGGARSSVRSGANFGGRSHLGLTILEECWRPSFARSLVPKKTALERDLEEYLETYNRDRAHTGRLTRGAIPGELVYGAKKVRS